jgi:UDP-N-acetyl-D-mannosaminuronate dehydrogenase
VIGLGYVGVSLVIFVGTVTSTVLLDIDYESIRALQQYTDSV